MPPDWKHTTDGLLPHRWYLKISAKLVNLVVPMSSHMMYIEKQMGYRESHRDISIVPYPPLAFTSVHWRCLTTRETWPLCFAGENRPATRGGKNGENISCGGSSIGYMNCYQFWVGFTRCRLAKFLTNLSFVWGVCPLAAKRLIRQQFSKLPDRKMFALTKIAQWIRNK